MAKEAAKQKKNKYRNKKVYVFADGYFVDDRAAAYDDGNIRRRGKPIEVYDSVKEFERGNELKLLEKAGVISNLQRQTSLVISPKANINGEHIKEIAYKADFMYVRNGKTVVEDVKPFDANIRRYRLTKDFSIKWKLLKTKYPDYLFELW